MNKSFHLLLKRSIFNIPMLSSILVGCIFLLQPLYKVIYFSVVNSKKLDYAYLFYIPHASGVFDLFAPVLCVLPSVTLFCDDYNTGFLKNVLIRTNKNRYIKNIILCNGIAGGLTILIPMLFIFIISIIFGEPYLIQNLNENFGTLYEMSVFENIQFIWGGILVCFIILTLSFIFGVVWSTIGLTISAFLTNRYIAISFPIILYYSLSLILSRYNLIAFSPMNTIIPNGGNINSLCFIYIYQLSILVMSIIVLKIGLFRRLKNG